MKTYLHKLILLSVCIAFLFSNCNKKPDEEAAINRERDFTLGWKFVRDSLSGAEAVNFDDAKWRSVDLPHDYSIEDLPGEQTEDQIGPFSKTSPGNTSTGYVLGGTGWYRKHFTIGEEDKGKAVHIVFDGVYMESDVWLNGQHLGFHPYGYTPFAYNLTPHLKPAGEENILAVRVQNKGRNSRWYSGSGIYRDVKLVVTSDLHFDTWPIYVTTPVVSKDSAQVKIDISIQNDSQKERKLTVKTRLLGSNDKATAEEETKDISFKPGKSALSQSFVVKSPQLWSPSQPELYKAEVSLLEDGKVIDQYIQNFGIRSIEYTATEGFKLNGQAMLLKGACMHHDNGLLGSAAIRRAEERRVEIMKANGYNAIRTSHNPPSSAFLEACDRLGMLVIDEAFDMWEHPKNPQDYHRYFKEWSKKDLEAMLLRDRNHPSVIMWSIGNEIYERADTSGLRIANGLVKVIHDIDPSRPVNAAICHFWDRPGREWPEVQPAFTYQDVAGYNYKWENYEPDHQQFPDRIIVGTESFPVSAFDNWQQVEKHPFVIGDFVWTGMDYLGETGIGHTLLDNEEDRFAMTWPWYNAWCGDIDICGFKKPQSFYRDVVWGQSDLEMAVHTPLPEGRKEKVSYWGWPNEQQSWTWPGNEGKRMEVSVYSSAQKVRLELNGVVIGEKAVSPESKLTAKFEIPYSEGELKAVAIKDGKEIATKTLKTAGQPVALRLTPDRGAIKADRGDLSYVTVEAIDEDGDVVPGAAVSVTYSVSGSGEIAAVGNAAPNDMQSFRKLNGKTYDGRAMIIVRPATTGGTITIRAKGEGMEEVKADIEVAK